MMETNDPEAFKLSLAKMLADEPDFMLDLGDTFKLSVSRLTLVGIAQPLRTVWCEAGERFKCAHSEKK